MIALSVNRKTSECIKKTAAYVFSCVCGMIVSGIFLSLSAAVMYVLSMPPESSGALSLISLAAGCLCAGYVCGAIKLRKGLRSGIICAAVISAAVLAASALSGNLTGSAAAAKMITAVISCCAGSVFAVNRKE